MAQSFLHLENGDVFSGESPDWQTDQFHGEVVFTTGMTGYDLSLTDPSFFGQIIVFTYPMLGNYGVVVRHEWESTRIHAAGVVVATAHGQSFVDWLQKEAVPLIASVDTRALTKIIRDHGSMPGVISSSQVLTPFAAEGSFCPGQRVSVREPVIHGVGKKKVVLVDCGVKANIVRMLKRYDLSIKQVPYSYDYSHEEFDGVLLANGPGNPESYGDTIGILKKALVRQKPIFGICLGTQLMALAAGAKTYKLRYGHRGHNQPCIDVQTRRCYITSQNHGYAIDEHSLPDGWRVTYRNVNDGSVEGIGHVRLPFFSVQFHPEAAPGPTDTQFLFEHFVEML